MAWGVARSGRKMPLGTHSLTAPHHHFRCAIQPSSSRLPRLRFPTAMVRPLRSLATFSFAISNIPFLPKKTVKSFSCEHSCDCE